MSSRTYLQGEARWAREQERIALGKADNLRDPRWLNQERDRRGIKARRARLDLRLALTDLHALDQGRLPETIAAAEKDADHWRILAEGYEGRIAADEDQPTLEDA